MDKERLCLCPSTAVSRGRQSTDTLVVGQAIEVIGPSVVMWIDSNEFPGLGVPAHCALYVLFLICIIFTICCYPSDFSKRLREKLRVCPAS